MARRRKKRDRLEERLEELEVATREPRSARARAALTEALAGQESFVAARAATLVREHALEGFEESLVGAFERFADAGAKGDPGSRAKLAIVEAMDAVDVLRHEPFLRAARCVQKEAAWGPPTDTAGPVRARAVLALGRGGFMDLPVLAGELLADPEAPVRRAALRALASHGDRAGAGLAAYKLRLGDEDPLVTSEAMNALLALAPDVGVPALKELLTDDDVALRELAAVALGESRRADALDALLDAMSDLVLSADRNAYFTALALHRSEPALRALLACLEGSHVDAVRALEALAIRRYEPEIRERVAEAARAAGLEDAFVEAVGE